MTWSDLIIACDLGKVPVKWYYRGKLIAEQLRLF